MNAHVSNLPIINREKVRTLVYATCRDRLWMDGITPYQDYLTAVADRADAVATTHYQAYHTFLPPGIQVSITAAYCGGLLHRAIDTFGMAFEDLVALTSLECASAVAAVSYDYRLVMPQRVQEHASRLYESPLIAQIIKLAEISWGVDTIVAKLALDPDSADMLILEWLPIADRYLRAMPLLLEHRPLHKMMHQVCTTIRDTHRACKTKQQRLELINSIQANIAARMAKVKSRTREGQRKEPTHDVASDPQLHRTRVPDA